MFLKVLVILLFIPITLLADLTGGEPVPNVANVDNVSAVTDIGQCENGAGIAEDYFTSFIVGPFKDKACLDFTKHRSLDWLIDYKLPSELQVFEESDVRYFSNFYHDKKFWVIEIPKDLQIKAIIYQRVIFIDPIKWLRTFIDGGHAQVRFLFHKPVRIFRKTSAGGFVVGHLDDVAFTPESIKKDVDKKINFLAPKGYYGSSVRMLSSIETYRENILKGNRTTQLLVDQVDQSLAWELFTGYLSFSARLAYEKPFIHYIDNCMTNTLRPFNRLYTRRTSRLMNPFEDFAPKFGPSYLAERGFCKKETYRRLDPLRGKPGHGIWVEGERHACPRVTDFNNDQWLSEELASTLKDGTAVDYFALASVEPKMKKSKTPLLEIPMAESRPDYLEEHFSAESPIDNVVEELRLRPASYIGDEVEMLNVDADLLDQVDSIDQRLPGYKSKARSCEFELAVNDYGQLEVEVKKLHKVINGKKFTLDRVNRVNSVGVRAQVFAADFDQYRLALMVERFDEKRKYLSLILNNSKRHRRWIGLFSKSIRSCEVNLIGEASRPSK
tara:strand:+ start:62251 stop:63915 length:1665 start_codon:yes stop_codon:yes gene_type:complete